MTETYGIQARFSALLNACLNEGPQVVTRRGNETAVLVAIDEWHRLKAAARPSLKQLLLADSARPERLVPERGKAVTFQSCLRIF